MNGVDYSKTVARERENTKNIVSKANKASEKQIQNLQERNETAEAKLREHHIEDRTELEKSYQGNIQNLKEKTAESLAKKSEHYHKDVEKQREEFELDSNLKRKDFDQRLSDIKESYHKAFESERDNHQGIQNKDKTHYKKNISGLVDKHHRQTEAFSERMKETGTGLKDSYNRERQQLVRAHEDQLTDVYKSERRKQSDLSHRVRNDVDKTKEAYQAHQDHLRDYMGKKVTNQERRNLDQTMAMSQDNSRRAKELTENMQNEMLQTNRQHEDKVTQMQTGFQKQMRAQDNDRRRRENDSGEMSDVMRKQNGLSEKAYLENRIKDLSAQNQEVKNKYQVRANEDGQNFRGSMKNMSSDYAEQLDNITNKVTSDKLVAITDEKEKAQNAILTKDKQARNDKYNYDTSLSFERKVSKEKVDNLKDHFNKSMTSLEEKLQLSMSELKRINKADKTEYMKKSTEKHLNDIMDIRRSMEQAMDATIQTYEQKLSEARNQNESLKMTMEQKVSDIVSYTDKKMSTDQMLNNERRKTELYDQKMAMDAREHQVKTDTNKIISEFQKKLDKLTKQSDFKIKLLTDSYENKLRDQATLHTKEQQTKDSVHKAERDNLKQLFEKEKVELTAKLQTDIEAMKATHDEQLRQMKNYAKIS